MSFKALNSIKNRKLMFGVLLIFAASFLIAPQTLAATWAAQIVGGIIYVFIYVLGLILILVMKCLILIASYQHFIDAGAVIEGWAVVRDLANMFFVVILLVIAFSTILHLENYSYKKWLPKLILMAILINFSKTICGLMIDVAQIIMLTFVNSFKEVAGGNMIDMLGIKDVVTFAKNNSGESWTLVGAYVLGLIYMIVALVVLITMMMMLVMRLVMIWIYVVLSPFAYLLAAFPGGAQYSSQWWKEFTQNLIVGPVIAFFVWLSFAALQTDKYVSTSVSASQEDTASTTAEQNSFGNSITRGKDNEAPVMETQASTPGTLIKFVIGIGMLLGGLKISQQIGSAAGGIAGKGMAKLNKMGTGAMGVGNKIGMGLAAGAGGLGMAAAKKLKVKEGLGAIASQTGFGGTILAATGIRSLATSGLVGLNKQQKKIEEKAQTKIENLKDTRVIARYANQTSITAAGMAAKKKARNMMPETIKDATARQNHVASMSDEDLGKMSEASWYQYGKLGGPLPNNAREFLQSKNRPTGAYNLGLQDENPGRPITDYVARKDARGNDVKYDKYGSYMNAATPPSADKLDYFRRENKHKYEYYKDTSTTEEMTNNDKRPSEYHKDAPVAEEMTQDGTNKVKPENQNQARGEGNLSINKFAKGQATLAVDFEKLNMPEIEKGAPGDSDWRNTRGVNTNDQGEIQKIASQMVAVIGQEIASLQAKPNLSAGDTKRMENLQAAKARFEKPEELSNLSLVNSSASKFKMSDVKETMIHEEVHGLGYENEDDVRYATGKIMETHNYDARKDKGSVDKILSEKPAANSSPEEILEKEKKDSVPEAMEVDTTKLEASLERFSNQLKKVGDSFGEINIAAPAKGAGGNYDLGYLLKGLKKAMTENKKSTQKAFAALGGQKAETPLEFDVIVNNLNKPGRSENLKAA